VVGQTQECEIVFLGELKYPIGYLNIRDFPAQKNVRFWILPKLPFFGRKNAVDAILASQQTSSLNLGPNTSKNIRSPSKHKAKTLAAAAKTPREQKHCRLSQKHAAPHMQCRRAHAAWRACTCTCMGQPRRVCRMVAHVAAGRHH